MLVKKTQDVFMGYDSNFDKRKTEKKKRIINRKKKIENDISIYSGPVRVWNYVFFFFVLHFPVFPTVNIHF